MRRNRVFNVTGAGWVRSPRADFPRADARAELVVKQNVGKEAIAEEVNVCRAYLARLEVIARNYRLGFGKPDPMPEIIAAFEQLTRAVEDAKFALECGEHENAYQILDLALIEPRSL